MRLGVATSVALLAMVGSEAASAQTVLLPSPTRPLDTKVPLGADVVTVPPILPTNTPVSNREAVSADVLRDGTVIRVGVRQRLELRGTGDFSFQVNAPLRDVRAGPGSQGEPGFRRTGILWQGFLNRRRVLVALADLAPRDAAEALPLRLELADGTLRLRNATAVRAFAFTAPARPADVRPVLRRIAADPLAQHSVRVRGPVARRGVVVHAPLRIRGVVREGGRVVQRFTRILGGPAPAAAQVAIRSDRPEVALDVEPVPLLPELRLARPGTSGSELVLLASTALLRLARVHQYSAFLGGPDPAGPTRTLYRYRIVAPPAAANSAKAGEENGVALTLLVAAGAVLAAAGFVMVWARL